MVKTHYAWLVCLGGALSLLAVMGLGVNSFSIYQPEIIALNGFTNAQGSWITTTRSLFILGALLCVNQLCARLGLRLVMTLGVLFVSVSCFCFGVSRSFPMYCFSAALTGIGYCLGGMVPLALILGNWFESRRALAIGLASAGSGVSTIFAPAVFTAIIRSAGVSACFFAEGTLLLVLAAAVWFLLRDTPAQLGLSPYSTGEVETSSPADPSAPGTYRRWAVPVVLAASFLLGGPVGPAFSHITVLLTGEGFDSVVVAGLLSFAGVMLIVGKIICGQLHDRLGALISNYIIHAAMLAGLILFCLSDRGSLPLVVLAVTCFFFGMAVTASSPAVWARDLAPAQDYASVVRAITTSYSLGMLVFGPVPGILADRFGSYIPAYALFALFQVVLTIMIQGVYHLTGAGRRPGRS